MISIECSDLLSIVSNQPSNTMTTDVVCWTTNNNLDVILIEENISFHRLGTNSETSSIDYSLLDMINVPEK